MAMYPELDGQVAIVTGAARGIGAAVATGLHRQGCRVALVDMIDVTSLLSDNSDAASAEEMKAYVCDVCDPRQVEQTVEAIHREFGQLDIVVNNAGIARDAMVWRMSDEQWRDVIETNLSGPFHFIRAVSPLLREQGHGRIVNIASINALRGKVGQANYSASKAGLIALTKTAARELGSAGITVNAVAPGMIGTDMTSGLSAETKETALRETVVGRVGTPEDVAAVVLFLCSDGARHITGEVIRVDGGQYI